jgi:hypothetical protein
VQRTAPCPHVFPALPACREPAAATLAWRTLPSLPHPKPHPHSTPNPLSVRLQWFIVQRAIQLRGLENYPISGVDLRKAFRAALDHVTESERFKVRAAPSCGWANEGGWDSRVDILNACVCVVRVGGGGGGGAS